MNFIQKLILTFVIALQLARPALSAPIKIGVTLGLTGAADRWSKYQKLGMQLAAEDLQAAGTDVQLIYEDSQSEPSRSVTAFNKLVDINHVDAVAGDVFHFLTAPLIPLADRRGKLLVSPSTPGVLCATSKGSYFSTGPQIFKSMIAFEQFLDLNPTVKKIALVSFQDPGWGEQHRDGWMKLAAKRQIEVTSTFESADFQQDFLSVLPGMLLKKPDAFFVAHQPTTFLRASKQLKFLRPIVFASNILEVPAAKGSLDTVEGVYFVDTLPDPDFARRFRERFNEEPILEPFDGYEAVRSIVEAIKFSPNNPQLGMRKVKYQGATGEFDFSQSCGGNQSEWVLKIFLSGEIVLLSDKVGVKVPGKL